MENSSQLLWRSISIVLLQISIFPYIVYGGKTLYAHLLRFCASSIRFVSIHPKEEERIEPLCLWYNGAFKLRTVRTPFGCNREQGSSRMQCGVIDLPPAIAILNGGRKYLGHLSNFLLLYRNF
jgi:hypothetical protein